MTLQGTVIRRRGPALVAGALLVLVAGCAGAEAGRSSAPATGFTVQGDGNHVIVWIWGDGSIKGTASPDTTTGAQDVTGPKVDGNLQVPVR